MEMAVIMEEDFATVEEAANQKMPSTKAFVSRVSDMKLINSLVKKKEDNDLFEILVLFFFLLLHCAGRRPTTSIWNKSFSNINQTIGVVNTPCGLLWNERGVWIPHAKN